MDFQFHLSFGGSLSRAAPSLVPRSLFHLLRFVGWVLLADSHSWAPLIVTMIGIVDTIPSLFESLLLNYAVTAIMEAVTTAWKVVLFICRNGVALVGLLLPSEGMILLQGVK